MIKDDPDFRLIKWIMGESKFNDNGTPSMMDDLRLYIMAAIAGVVVIIALFIVSIIHRYRKKILNLLKKIFNKMVFNGMIRSITIIYIQLCMTSGT